MGTCVSTDCKTPCLLSGTTCFAMGGRTGISEGWARVRFPLARTKQSAPCFGAVLHSG